MRACAERQGEDGEVAIDRAVGEGRKTGDGERGDKEIDRDEIEREQPRGAADLGLVMVLDHRDMELPRQ